MPAACHLLGPTWKGADLGPNRGAFLSIRHALQWAPWHLVEETETPSGRPRESAPGVCSLAPCALRVCAAGVQVPPLVLPVPETKQKPLSLGHRPSPGGGSPRLPSRGPPGRGMGEPSGLTACLCSHVGALPLQSQKAPVHTGAARPGSPSVSLCCTQWNSTPNPIGRLRF